MPLANDINVVHPTGFSPGAVELRPSLRAAIRLERRHGFERLMRGIAEGSYSILTEIVRECASTRDDASAILSIRPIGNLIAALRDPCQQVVLALAGHDIAPSKGEPNGKPVPFSDFYADLYRLAAGNLGWPPEQALSATPLEIVEAVKGRADLLKSIFGSAEQESEPVDPAAIDHKAGIARLKEIFGTGIGESVR
jgi:hypothetical protein